MVQGNALTQSRLKTRKTFFACRFQSDYTLATSASIGTRWRLLTVCQDSISRPHTLVNRPSLRSLRSKFGGKSLISVKVNSQFVKQIWQLILLQLSLCFIARLKRSCIDTLAEVFIVCAIRALQWAADSITIAKPICRSMKQLDYVIVGQWNMLLRGTDIPWSWYQAIALTTWASLRCSCAFGVCFMSSSSKSWYRGRRCTCMPKRISAKFHISAPLHTGFIKSESSCSARLEQNNSNFVYSENMCMHESKQRERKQAR